MLIAGGKGVCYVLYGRIINAGDCGSNRHYYRDGYWYLYQPAVHALGCKQVVWHCGGKKRPFSVCLQSLPKQVWHEGLKHHDYNFCWLANRYRRLRLPRWVNGTITASPAANLESICQKVALSVQQVAVSTKRWLHS